MTCIKICGINSEGSFDAAVEAGADGIGFVFFQRSPRFVMPRQAARLSARHQGGPRRIGLFVAPKPEEIAEVLDATALDALQIYGTIELCRAMAETFNLPVWQAIAVKDRADLPVQFEGVERFVIEGKAPENATRPGGNAAKVDWPVLSGWKAPLNWILAGGLTADNVAEAIRTSRATAVDVSSGVESLPGVKSPVLIRRFIGNARNALHLLG
jgi:phosphoribosylanthranilate isomerase